MHDAHHPHRGAALVRPQKELLEENLQGREMITFQAIRDMPLFWKYQCNWCGTSPAETTCGRCKTARYDHQRLDLIILILNYYRDCHIDVTV